MKVLLLGFVALALATAGRAGKVAGIEFPDDMPEAIRPKALRFSTANKDTRDAIINELIQHCVVMPDGAVATWMVPKAWNADRWVMQFDVGAGAASGMKRIATRVGQVAGGSVVLSSDLEYAVRLRPGENHAEGDPVNGFGRRDGVFDYLTVLGAARSLPLYTILPSASPAAIQEALKSGQKFAVLLGVPTTCGGCGGLRIVRAYQGSMTRTKCEKCSGTGSVSVMAVRLVEW